MTKSLIPTERIERVIYVIRDQKVMLDHNLAKLYGVETKNLKRAIKRNRKRFPVDFMFQLSEKEFQNWRCQIGTSNSTVKMGLRRRPYAFTEQGVAMLSSVLNSSKAIMINIEIMRAFVKMRHILTSQKKLSKIVIDLREFVLKNSNQTTQEIRRIWKAIEKLAQPTNVKEQSRIGFELK